MRSLEIVPEDNGKSVSTAKGGKVRRMAGKNRQEIHNKQRMACVEKEWKGFPKQDYTEIMA